MTSTSRRTVLTALATAAVSGPVLIGAGAAPAHAADDLYTSNTDLYTRLAGREGTDFGRRYKRHEQSDNSISTAYPFPRTTVMAPHGGGIETGTSELCLAVAGYHPATFERSPAGGPVHDYWMFEGLRSSNNGELHVTSVNCDDRVALSMAGGSLNVLSLHGCTAAQAGVAGTRPEAVVVGGLHTAFKDYLRAAFGSAGFRTVDGSTVPALAGVQPLNIANRTVLGKGGQLEITTELRQAMFGVNTRAGRPGSTTEVFDRFVAAARTAIARLEARPDQAIL
ncbi:poly-gamma-glutamate hydrolase family protein [Streptomyces paludis]|uniref:Phage replication protein n=1 Tax=Streptomyces paludis TaxID=2282738 RepID=A0A345HKN2_9ACTN|nr:poly-gamma-glutamate hydrolase family protein [Streptomyces paludis]AXG77256.1 phage replication protein [Streptomyces paludis]